MRPTPKPKTVDPVRGNAGVEAAYRKRLDRLIAEMNASTAYWLKAAWRETPPTHLAQDASASAMLNLQRTMARLGKKWLKRFDDLAPDVAAAFAKAATGHAERAMMSVLDKAGFTVKFRPTVASMEGYRAVLGENVQLIKSIPAEYLADVQQQVWASVRAGGDLATLSDGIEAKYGIARRRAEFIARDQNNKATAVVENVRRQQLGITEAIWVHSGGGKEPRPEHVKAGADKLRFSLDKGAYLEGKWTLPGVEPNCRCTSRSIIPGLEG